MAKTPVRDRKTEETRTRIAETGLRLFVSQGYVETTIDQIAAAAVTPGNDRSMREQMLRIIEPISGAVTIVSYEPVSDHKGTVQNYKVVVTRE